MIAPAFKKYVSLARCSMQNTLAYRLSFILNFLASFIGLIAMYCLWQAIYTGQDQLSGFTWSQMQAYLLVTFFVNSMLSYYSESSITSKIIDGSVMMDLLRPIQFQKARLAETLGSCVLEGLLSCILIGLAAIFTFGISLPHDAGTLLLFAFSIVSSILLKFSIVYLSALLCFWTTSSFGIYWARTSITNLLSGALVPLAFFPGWLQSTAMVLPFQGIVNTPVTIGLGMTAGTDALQLIAIQWVWIVLLWLLGKWMWSRAVRQITIHGG
ncbi:MULTISPECIES: ABC transporter permease [Paenibacillus]|uniref:Daunorubicin ABC transporter permease n=1 Tax=Paenibacillus vini TaxID=1476024 RepID=A0ABQ4MHD4_9BACL|nr:MULTISPECIES: ABC-2 family transporter protein [Paenibacillus]MDN4070131.1 ABC-2 family transporter protein [Paenibacillus vini]GIP55396.1 daunorubicin ABC transporter permease [Paenibacillus vini]